MVKRSYTDRIYGYYIRDICRKEQAIRERQRRDAYAKKLAEIKEQDCQLGERI